MRKKKSTTKAKLTRPDGTIVEIEGDHEEVLKAVLALTPPPPAPVVVVQPALPPYLPPQPIVLPFTYPVSPSPYELSPPWRLTEIAYNSADHLLSVGGVNVDSTLRYKTQS